MAEEETQNTKWEDRFDVVKKIRVSDPTFGWMHLIIGRRKTNGEIVMRLKRYKNWFTIPSKRYLAYVRKMLDRGAEETGWDTDLSDEEIGKMVNENSELMKQKEKSKKQMVRQREVINNLLAQVGQLREAQFAINLENFKKDMKDFKQMLEDDSKEKEIQQWLYEHPWVFGPNYVEGSKEEITRGGDRIDFLLQRYDTFYDIVELKLPTSKLFVGKAKDAPQQDISREYSMSAELKDAISQIIGYLEKYEIDKTQIQWDRGISIHKPRGIIVIGKIETANKRALKTLNSYLHNIEVLTYSDMIDLGNNFIKLIEKRANQGLKSD